MARYIDADALIEKIKAKATEMFTVDSVYEYYMDALIDVEDIIKAEPTADVVERKKGEWIETDVKGMDCVYCSECEDSYCPVPIDPSWYFCPHCGADMRGDNNADLDSPKINIVETWIR